jgi:ATP-dependent Zn protease
LTRWSRNVVWILVLFLLAFLIKMGPLSSGPAPKHLTYDELRSAVKQGAVHEVVIEKTRVRGFLNADNAAFVADYPQDWVRQRQLTQLLVENGVKIRFPAPILSEAVKQILFSIALPILLIASFWFLRVLRRFL